MYLIADLPSDARHFFDIFMIERCDCRRHHPFMAEISECVKRSCVIYRRLAVEI